MRRSELAQISRAACTITGDREVLVIGSQAILGTFGEEELPIDATRSIEADIVFFDDPDGSKSDSVDGAIGELSPFHEMNGIYGQGVDLSTATLPSGWRERLVRFTHPVADPSEALCLDPHDLVVSKLVAGRQKDHEFARALLAAGLIDIRILRDRAELLAAVPGVKRRVVDWIEGTRRRGVRDIRAD